MSSKFLDKTGLDTLWAKIKSTFQTLGNLVTAWGSTPSDTKYPSEKLVKTSIDAISTNARTIPQDISKGTNVVVNSNGTLQTNYNWTATTFIGDTDLPVGVAGCFHHVGENFLCNEFISLNTSKEFTVESWYRVKTANTSTVRLTLACFDIDKKSIQATDICYGIGTLTTVAREIKNGDTEIYLTDLSASAWDTSTYYERRLIFWDYQNSLGYTYPPETYSKHTYYKSNSNNGTWLRDSLDRENNKITLIVPWDGGTVPVGTKVSRGGSGNAYYYAAVSPASGAATVWTKLSGKLKGFSNNVAGGGPFRPGTAFVKIGWVNANTASPEWFEFCGIELRENPSAFNGVLPVANGGTGKASVAAGNYLVGNGTSALTEKTPKQVGNNVLQALGAGDDDVLDTDYIIASNHTSGDTDATTFVRRTAGKLWNYIKSQISSVLGLTATSYGGNAATATTAAGYTNDGAIANALAAKADSSSLATVATSGSYSDLSNKPDIQKHFSTFSGRTASYGFVIGDTQTLNDGTSSIIQGSFSIAGGISDSFTPADGKDRAPIVGFFSIWARRDGSNYKRSARLYTPVAGINDSSLQVNLKCIDVSTGVSRWVLGFGSGTTPQAVTFCYASCSVLFDRNANLSQFGSPVTSAPTYANYFSAYKSVYIGQNDVGIGTTTKPVYVDTNGRVRACDDLVKAVSSIDTSTMDSDVLYVM